MKEFLWEAFLIDSGEYVYGGSFAESEEEAIERLYSYGYYKDIVLTLCGEYK